jgi:DNA-binding CsgD family transcriptional regulator
MSPREQLNSREIQVAQLVWQGKTNPEIASALGCTEQVVKNQLRGVFDKLGVWSRLELALYIAAHGGTAWAEKVRAQRLNISAGAASSTDLARWKELDVATG